MGQHHGDSIWFIYMKQVNCYGWPCCLRPVFLTLGKLRPRACKKFRARPGSKVSSRPALAAEQDVVLLINKTNQEVNDSAVIAKDLENTNESMNQLFKKK